MCRQWSGNERGNATEMGSRKAQARASGPWVNKGFAGQTFAHCESYIEGVVVLLDFIGARPIR